MAEAAPRGRFVWYDLTTTDAAAAQKFYTSLFGWTTQEFEGSTEPYTMWSNGADMLGGVMETDGSSGPPSWLASIAVADVDEAVAQAKQLGASVAVEPMDIPTVGRYAVLMDPQGAAFSLFNAAEHWPGSDAPAEVGSMSWHELATSDWSKAWDFYRELFGWEDATAMDMGPDLGMYQMFGRKGIPLGGIYNKGPAANVPGTGATAGPPSWLHYTRVDDVDRSVERVKELGGQVVLEPMEVPGGDRVAVCTDPQGAAFAVHATKAA